MMHKSRVYRVSSDVGGISGLARMLTQSSWCGCNGFAITVDGVDLVFLNDATCGDGAQEYAVFHGVDQIESITMSWCTEDEAAKHIRACIDSVRDGTVVRYAKNAKPRTDHGSTSCPHCA